MRVPTASKKIAFSGASLFFVIMNALAPWKVVLTVIAIFGAGVVTGGFLTKRTIKDAIRRSEEPRQSFTLTTDRLQGDLRLKPEQVEKIEPILRQVNTEFSNLLSLDLREREGILSRGQDRMNPILEPDQQARLQEIIEEEKRRVRLWLGAGESPNGRDGSPSRPHSSMSAPPTVTRDGWTIAAYHWIDLHAADRA